MQFSDYDNYLDKTVRNVLGELAKEKYLANWHIHGYDNGINVTLRFVPINEEGQPIGGLSSRHKSPSTVRRDTLRYNDWRQQKLSFGYTPSCDDKSISNEQSQSGFTTSNANPFSTNSVPCQSDIPANQESSPVHNTNMQMKIEQCMYDTHINGSHSVGTGGSVLNNCSLNEVGKQMSDPEVSSTSAVDNPVPTENQTVSSNDEDDDEVGSPIEYFKIVVEENTEDCNDVQTLLGQCHANKFVRYNIQSKSMEYCSIEEEPYVRNCLLENSGVICHPKFELILKDFCKKLVASWDPEDT